MSVEVYGYVMGAPWAPLWVRGDANLDPDDDGRGQTGEGADRG